MKEISRRLWIRVESGRGGQRQKIREPACSEHARRHVFTKPQEINCSALPLRGTKPPVWEGGLSRTRLRFHTLRRGPRAYQNLTLMLVCRGRLYGRYTHTSAYPILPITSPTCSWSGDRPPFPPAPRSLGRQGRPRSASAARTTRWCRAAPRPSAAAAPRASVPTPK